ncbi:MAG: SGNH/GDSL hydrolase family protein [Bacteroidetes bacterium]|nr:SGNH/GDSL hydrolase family protein [Bacteroidota bacterium]
MKKLTFTSLLFLFTILSTLAQTDEELGLHSEGDPWNFYPTKEHNPELPNVLLIGNSVMNGFKNTVIPGLKGKTNVDYWLTPKHLNSDFLFEDLAKIVKYRKYDVIHFNIGLHGWPEGRIAENEYVPLLEKYVSTIKKNAENSRIIWGSITPVTETGKPELNKEINPTIAKRNKLAKGVMDNFNIPANDLYGLVADKLELAKGDRFHWTAKGYELMGKQTIICILNELEISPK